VAPAQSKLTDYQGHNIGRRFTATHLAGFLGRPDAAVYGALCGTYPQFRAGRSARHRRPAGIRSQGRVGLRPVPGVRRSGSMRMFHVEHCSLGQPARGSAAPVRCIAQVVHITIALSGSLSMTALLLRFCAAGLRTRRARIASSAGENAATRGGSGDPPRECCPSGDLVVRQL
jgi:hypothetical protein